MAPKFEPLIDKARRLARPISPSDDCRAGDVASVVVAASGKQYTGICVEFECGLGFCAEHAAVAEMLKHGESRTAYVVAVTHTGEVLPPCGRCREMMWQLDDSNKATKVILSTQDVRPLSELLPYR